MKVCFLATLFSSILVYQLVQGQCDSTPATPYYDSVYSSCKQCPDATPFYNGFILSCVATCPTVAPAYDSNKWCYTCPNDYPQWNSGLRNCTKCSGTNKYNPYISQCVASCPAYAPNWNSTGKVGVCTPCSSEALYWLENTTFAQCVERCEFPKPSFDSNNICQPCDESAPYWDLDPAITPGYCVVDCPGVRGDPGTDKFCKACPVSTPKYNKTAQVCQVCPSNAPYYDRNGDCIPRCADVLLYYPTWDSNNWCQSCASSQPYWDNGNSVCTSTCPRQRPFASSNTRNWCSTCPSTASKWDPISKNCTDTCPTSIPDTDSDSWCVACNRSTPFWNTTNSKCEICPSNTPYWDPSSGNGTCVTACPASRPSADSDKWCMPCAQSTRYWDIYSSSGACVTTCPVIAPVFDSNKWCLKCMAPTPYWDNITSLCLNSCPSSRPVINSNNWCLACPGSTPYWDPAQSQCVATCPLTTPKADSNKVCVACPGGTPIWDPSISSCVSSCNGLAPVLNGTVCEYCPSNLPNWDSSVPACVSSCPVDKPYLNPNKWCKACVGTTPYWNYLNSVCVTTCPRTHPDVDSNDWCQACPSTAPKWDDVAVTCLADCPAARPVIDAYNWCLDCPTGTPFWNPISSACVTPCPPSIPSVDVNNWCKACPSFTPKWDSIPATCVTNCPASRPATGAYNWCQACPAETPYWNSTALKCTPSCPPETPMMDSNNWCQACPSATPYWDAIASVCVSVCPQNTPTIDNNKHCNPCPAEFPSWNDITTQCLEACPLSRPVRDANNWCQECPSSTPYWDSINRVCVALCPPQSPSVSSGYWCKQCTDSTLKWDPTTSQCVATCPKELPFFNKNSVPPACEQGPNVQDVVNFLETSGVAVPVALGGIQLFMPSLPYAAITILLMSLLKYVRYFNINFPAKLSSTFQQGSLNVPSLNFGPLFPEDWKQDTLSHPAPYRFAQYDINGLFIANFWRGIGTALIIAFGVGVVKVLVRIKFKSEAVVQVRQTAKNFLIWNYVFSFFISNIANLALCMFIEYQSLYLSDDLGIGSLLVNALFVQLSVFGIFYMIKRIRQFHKMNKQATRNQEKLELDESVKVLLEKFNHEHLIQMLFVPIVCIRAVINAIIIGAVNNPIAQCSLLIILNLIMIAYNIRHHPYRLIVDNIQIIGYEAILLIVNITCLHLGTLSSEEQYASEEAGDLIVTCNILMFVLSFIFQLIKVLLFVINLIKEKFKLKVPSSNTSVQTDDSSALELTPRSAHCARLETGPGEMSPNNKARNLSFAGSVSMDVGDEGEQSPGVATRNLNSNNIKKSFHIVRIPEGADESQHLSRYVDAGV